MMNFALQLGHPRIRSGRFPVAQSLSEALDMLFRAQEESVYVFWHDIPIRFRYRQDLSRCFDDILAMVWLMQRDHEGATKVALDTQLLKAAWEVRWKDDACRIEAAFAERDELFAPYAEALNRYPEVHMERSAFLREWNTLLHQIIVSMEAGDVEIQDGVERRKWEMLQRVDRSIAEYGTIYTRA